MNNDPLERLRIASTRRPRASGTWWLVGLGVGLVTGVALYLAWPRAGDESRAGMKSGRATTGVDPKASVPGGSPPAREGAARGADDADGTVLTVSGYIVARERIEISPRFLGVVRWIGVRKGDAVTNGQVVVRLDDAEYRARLAEVEAQEGVARVAVDRARMDLRRSEELVGRRVEMQKVLDDARLALASAEAQLRQAEAGRGLVQTYLDWCVIRSPVDGVVLEKLADVGELVTPQAFGTGRGPSTFLVAVADLADLQVEVDVNESDLGRIRLGQRCVVSPAAYPEKEYGGVVAEVAPEANRAKGTLQVKVGVEKPDRFLTPELSAKVRFLRAR